jgi:hypothetical protein
VPGGGVEGFEAPVIKNEKFGACEGTQQTRMTAIAARQSQVGEQPRCALIENRVVVATGLVAEGASQPTLPDAGGPDQCQIVVGADPFPLGQLLEQGAVEPPGTAIINILDAGLLAQSGDTQSRGEALVLALGHFAIEQKPQPFAMAETFRFAVGVEFGEGLGHAVQAKGVEQVEGRMFEQDGFS